MIARDEPLMGAFWLVITAALVFAAVWLHDRWTSGDIRRDLMREQEDRWLGDLVCLACIAIESAQKKLRRGPVQETRAAMPSTTDPQDRTERAA